MGWLAALCWLQILQQCVNKANESSKEGVTIVSNCAWITESVQCIHIVKTKKSYILRNDLKGWFVQKCTFYNHLLTLMLFQNHVQFFFFITQNNIFKKNVSVHTVKVNVFQCCLDLNDL